MPIGAGVLRSSTSVHATVGLVLLLQMGKWVWVRSCLHGILRLSTYRCRLDNFFYFR